MCLEIDAKWRTLTSRVQFSQQGCYGAAHPLVVRNGVASSRWRPCSKGFQFWRTVGAQGKFVLVHRHAWFCIAMLCVPWIENLTLAAAERATRSGGVTRAEARFAGKGNLPVIEIEAIGKTLRCVIDTAAGRSIFDNRWRPRLGSVTRTLSVPNRTGSQAEIDIFDSPVMRIGGVEIRSDAIAVTDLHQIYPLETDVDCCIGMDILHKFVLTIDSDRGIMQLLRDVPPNAGDRLPIEFDEAGQPTLPVFIAGVPVSCEIRTGTTASVCVACRLFAALEKRGALSAISPILSEADLIASYPQGLVSQVALGPFLHQNVAVVNNLMHAVGMGYLSRYAVTLDFPGRMAYFKAGREFDRRDQTNQTGIALTARDGAVVVERVRPNSPGGAAGILERDVIVGLGDARSRRFTAFEADQHLTSGHDAVSLQIRRDGRQLNLRVALRDRLIRTDAAAAAPPTRSDANLPRQVLCEVGVPRHGDEIVLPMRVSGISRPLLMLVDIGSSATMLDMKLHSDIGAKVGRRTERILDSEIAVELHRFERAAINDFVLADEGIAEVGDLTLIRDSSGYDVDGILGVDLLQRHVVQFDFDAGRLRFLSAVPADSGTKLRVRYTTNGQPAVAASVDNNTSAWFIVDTGCQGPNRYEESLFWELAGCGAIREIQRHDDQFLVPRAIENRIPCATGFANRTAVGPFMHRDLIIVTHRSVNLLGLDYLSRYVVTLDFPNGALYLKPGAAFERQERTDTSGVSVVRQGRRYVVATAESGSPAETAGLKVGDVISRINRLESCDLTLFQVRNLLWQDGGTAELTVLRGDLTIETTLKCVRRSRRRAGTAGAPESPISGNK